VPNVFAQLADAISRGVMVSQSGALNARAVLLGMDVRNTGPLFMMVKTVLIRQSQEQLRKVCCLSRRPSDALIATRAPLITTIVITTIRWSSKRFVANAIIGAALRFL
jgi:hypothetical protein